MATLGAPTRRLSILAIREPAVFIKVPEIVLLVITIITFCVNNNGSPAYVLSVLLPCLINALVFLAVYLMGYNQLRQTPVELALYIYSATGLFISFLILILPIFRFIASGVFCLFLTFIYIIDIFLSYICLVDCRSSSTSNIESASPEAVSVSASASAQHSVVRSRAISLL